MTSVKAENRTLRDWFSLVRQGKLNLPRFQRREAWGENEIVALLNSVLAGLPAGSALTLLVGNEEQFKGRPIAGAPATVPPVTEQLLDGQQRLTALWRSLKDNYADRTFFITFEVDELKRPDLSRPSASDESRYKKGDRTYPLWANDPQKCWRDKASIPVRLLDPDDDKIGEWVDAALPDASKEETRAFEKRIRDLRDLFSLYNLPFLALPKTTPPKIALDVFVKMNTSFVKLSSFDISVAYMEAIAGEALHDKLADLEKANPSITRFNFIQDLILDVAAYRCDLTPGVAGYLKINWRKITDEWDKLAAGISGVLELLEQERIFDERRLPSYPPVPVVAALWEHRGQADSEGRARLLLKRYLWHAFLTDRYQRSTATNAIADFRALLKVIQKGADPTTVPAFNTKNHPLADVETIASAGWPKEKNVLGRALLVLQLQCNALDFADASPATAQTVVNREYHHLFPAATLEGIEVPDDQIWRAVNCALITWRTNRKLSDQDPLVYLQKRTEHALNGEDEIRSRLRTHLVYFPHLQVGPYASLGDDERKRRVTEDYTRFCQSRATLLHAAAVHLAAGKLLTADSIAAAWEEMDANVAQPVAI
jgi:hypothetical protein